MALQTEIQPQAQTADSPKVKPHMKYRRDIDGLRAVAVLSVVAFHIQALTTRFPGGYVGVDVFFVISGYLISSIIFLDISNSQFSIASFYERRIRRIFPALLFVMGSVSIVAYLSFFPNELAKYAKSLLAATLSASNFYFWQQAGYFDAPLSHPLLHTWSLAVEEQFYILFPLFLVIVRRFFPGRLRSGVLLLAAISFGISAVEAYRDPNTAFYMPYTRAWELLLGTVLSLKMLPPLRSLLARNVATVAGLAAIAWSVLRYTSATHFPGAAAILPCGGAVLIIWAGESGSSVVGKILATRPVVFIGLISYSLYLWHWPLIVFQRMGILYGYGQSNLVSTAVIFFLSIALATATWAFVENPFRKGPLRRLSGRPLFTLAAAASGVLIVLCAVTMLQKGFPGRFPQRAVDLAAYMDVKQDPAFTRHGSCFLTDQDKVTDFDTANCLQQKPGEKNYLLVGDSHAAMLWYSLAHQLPNTNVMEAAASGCRAFVYRNGASACDKLMDFLFTDYLLHHRIDQLLVVNRWNEKDPAQLGKLVAWAQANHVPLTIVGPNEEYDAPLPRLLAYSVIRNNPKYPSLHRISNVPAMDRKMQSLAQNTWHVNYISLYQTMCPSDNCLEYADPNQQIPLMFDSNHFSHPGSILVVNTLLATKQLPQ